MAVNSAANFNSGGAYGTGDVEQYIADKTLPLTQNYLVAYQFGDPLRLPKGRGTQYAATRYIRVPLPFAPLSEGVPPVGETMTIQQVLATAQQWGDKITITDVAELTIKHPLFQKAIELTALQVAETLERNTFNNLMAGTQIDYVNTKGSRANLAAGDVMNSHEVNRAFATLTTIGAPRYNGSDQTDLKLNAEQGGARASMNPRTMPHYVGILHPLTAADLRENASIAQAWTYSDVNRLYNAELGEWMGVRWTESNMVPFWVGNAVATGSPGSAGTLANGTYKITFTGSDTQAQYEQQIYTISAGIVVIAGPNGSISVTTPSTPGFTWNVYITAAGSSNLLNLATTPSGPTVGPMAGQAVQLPGNTAVVLTGIGIAQVPPAAPTSGVTVFPVFILGKGAYGQVTLDDIKFSYLKNADKSDPLNQLRVVGWKVMYGTLIQNQQFFMRIECASAFSATFG
jgi:N4-gp56 family major capsid protein